jgi:hypothetical protein
VCRYASQGVLHTMPTWHGELWVAGLYVSMLSMGGGVGNITPANMPEYVIFIISIALGSTLWALVVGTICGISATGNPFNMKFKHNMDQLNYFLEDTAMPIDLRHRAREYLRNARELGKKVSYNEVIDSLSPEVRKDIVLKLSAKTLQCVWYLHDIEEVALVELAQRMQREGYAPRERLSLDKLTILMRGVASKSGIILTFQGGQVGKHPFWGEDIILHARALRDRKPAAALTYVEVNTLTKPDLDFVLDIFPKSAAHVRKAAVLIAVKRAMVVVSDYVKIQENRERINKMPAKFRKQKANAERITAMRKSAAQPQPTCTEKGLGPDRSRALLKSLEADEEADAGWTPEAEQAAKGKRLSAAGPPGACVGSVQAACAAVTEARVSPRSALRRRESLACAGTAPEVTQMMNAQGKQIEMLSATVGQLAKQMEKMAGLSA